MRIRKLWKISGVYTITNIINNKMYVGHATNLSYRKSRHFNDLKNNRHSNFHLQSAVNYYGIDNFKFELLEECEKEFLYVLEHWWCNMLNVHDRKFGYNVAPTDPRGKPKIISEETRLKMGMCFKGGKHSQETKDLISKLHKGNKYRVGHTPTQKTRDLMSIQRLGKKRTPEVCEILRKAQAEFHGIKLLHIETNQVFESISEAARQFGINRLTLQDQLIFKRSCCKFKYYDLMK